MKAVLTSLVIGMLCILVIAGADASNQGFKPNEWRPIGLGEALKMFENSSFDLSFDLLVLEVNTMTEKLDYWSDLMLNPPSSIKDVTIDSILSPFGFLIDLVIGFVSILISALVDISEMLAFVFALIWNLISFRIIVK